jgi:hypothetical protein
MGDNSSGIPANAVIAGDDTFSLETYLMKPYSWHNLSPQQSVKFTITDSLELGGYQGMPLAFL